MLEDPLSIYRNQLYFYIPTKNNSFCNSIKNKIGISLTKEQDFYTANYKTCWKKLKTTNVHGLGGLILRW